MLRSFRARSANAFLAYSRFACEYLSVFYSACTNECANVRVYRVFGYVKTSEIGRIRISLKIQFWDGLKSSRTSRGAGKGEDLQF